MAIDIKDLRGVSCQAKRIVNLWIDHGPQSLHSIKLQVTQIGVTPTMVADRMSLVPWWRIRFRSHPSLVFTQRLLP